MGNKATDPDTGDASIGGAAAGPVGAGRYPRTGAFSSSSEEPSDEPTGYYDSSKNVKITPERAAREIRNHHLDPEDFFNEVGHKASYMAHHVLDWLGY